MISASACLIAGILTSIIGLMGLISARRFNDPRESLGFIVIILGVCMMFSACIVSDSESMKDAVADYNAGTVDIDRYLDDGVYKNKIDELRNRDALRKELENEQLGQAGT